MAYINGKKVLQVVKTEGIQHYKHSVKMQGTYESVQYTVYAELISTDGDNWANAGLNFTDVMDTYEGIVAGKNNSNNKFQYLSCSGAAAQYQSELYYDIENRTAPNYETIDANILEFIEDTVTPL